MRLAIGVSFQCYRSVLLRVYSLVAAVLAALFVFVLSLFETFLVLRDVCFLVHLTFLVLWCLGEDGPEGRC